MMSESLERVFTTLEDRVRDNASVAKDAQSADDKAVSEGADRAMTLNGIKRRGLLVAAIASGLGRFVHGETSVPLERAEIPNPALIKQVKDVLIARDILDQSFEDVRVQFGVPKVMAEQNTIILNADDYTGLNAEDSFAKLTWQLAYQGSHLATQRGREILSPLQEEYRALQSQSSVYWLFRFLSG